MGVAAPDNNSNLGLYYILYIILYYIIYFEAKLNHVVQAFYLTTTVSHR